MRKVVTKKVNHCKIMYVRRIQIKNLWYKLTELKIQYYSIEREFQERWLMGYIRYGKVILSTA